MNIPRPELTSSKLKTMTSDILAKRISASHAGLERHFHNKRPLLLGNHFLQGLLLFFPQVAPLRDTATARLKATVFGP